MYAKAPDAAELAAFGLTLDDVAGEPVEIWPDNRSAFELFGALQTQWRVGMNGPIGLDYNVLYHRMDRMGLTPERYDDLEADIAAMEVAALGEIYSERGKDGKK